MYHLKLYLKMIGIVFSSQLQYRTTFLIGLVTYTFMPIIDMLVIFFYFSKFTDLGGWSGWEVAMIYSITSIGFGLTESFMRGFDVFPFLIQNGNYDRMLLRPVNIVMQIIGCTFPLTRLGKVFLGIVVIVISWQRLNIPVDSMKIGLIILAILGSFSIYFGIYMLMGAIAFITVKPLSIFKLFSDGTREMARFPISAYPKWFARFYIFAIPVACATYFPVSFILEKPDVFNTSATFQILSPLICFLFLGVCFIIWSIFRKKYESTGN